MKLNGNRIKRSREKLGFTLDMVGEQAGLSPQSVFRAEHGGEIQPSTARKLAGALGVTIADLMEEETASPKAPALLLDERQRVPVTGEFYTGKSSRPAAEAEVDGLGIASLLQQRKELDEEIQWVREADGEEVRRARLAELYERSQAVDMAITRQGPLTAHKSSASRRRKPKDQEVDKEKAQAV